MIKRKKYSRIKKPSRFSRRVTIERSSGVGIVGITAPPSTTNTNVCRNLLKALTRKIDQV